MSVDYLLHESSVGYAIFQVVHQADTVGNRLKEVQDSVQVSAVIVIRYIILTYCRTLQDLERWLSLSVLHHFSKRAGASNVLHMLTLLQGSSASA